MVATPFTVHLELGTTLPDGGVRLRAHVALPTAFARYLHGVLGEALALSDSAVAAELPGPEVAAAADDPRAHRASGDGA